MQLLYYVPLIEAQRGSEYDIPSVDLPYRDPADAA